MQELFGKLQSILTTTPDRWQSLAAAVPTELFNRQPAPGQWSAHECLNHLVQVELIFYSRIQAFLAGKDFPAYHPETEERAFDPTGPAGDLARQFAERRQHSLTLLAALQPADLERTARHQELGLVTLRQLLSEWAGHDLCHTMQGERALMQPFIESCGPWEIYFREHQFPSTE